MKMVLKSTCCHRLDFCPLGIDWIINTCYWCGCHVSDRLSRPRSSKHVITEVKNRRNKENMMCTEKRFINKYCNITFKKIEIVNFDFMVPLISRKTYPFKRPFQQASEGDNKLCSIKLVISKHIYLWIKPRKAFRMRHTLWGGRRWILHVNAGDCATHTHTHTHLLTSDPVPELVYQQGNLLILVLSVSHTHTHTSIGRA